MKYSRAKRAKAPFSVKSAELETKRNQTISRKKCPEIFFRALITFTEASAKTTEFIIPLF
jgi:hypothetical protein